MKVVLVTGASGLIGWHSLIPLRDAGFQVHAVSRIARENRGGDAGGVQWHQADLLDVIDRKRLLAEVRPSYLLHFAWDTRPGIYLEGHENFAWMAASLALLHLFRRIGGMRAVLAGTCFEYKFANHPLREGDPIAPLSTYAKCKDRLNRLAALYCAKNGLSYGWGRIFYVYGVAEQAGRLTPDLIRSLRRDEEMTIKYGLLRRDYMYAKDLSAAFSMFLASSVEGEVNICTGVAPSIEEYCRRLAGKLGREDLLAFRDETGIQPPLIVGDNRRLREEVGFSPSYDLESGFDEILEETHGWK